MALLRDCKSIDLEIMSDSHVYPLDSALLLLDVYSSMAISRHLTQEAENLLCEGFRSSQNERESLKMLNSRLEQGQVRWNPNTEVGVGHEIPCLPLESCQLLAAGKGRDSFP